ncbi:MAG: hypothetical protein Q7R52_02825 [archaeon]|nr:hypothetical protein [archaeon]
MAESIDALKAATVFGIIGGIAGGLAQIAISQRFKSGEKISTGSVILSSSIVALATFGAVFLLSKKSD